MTIAFNNAGGNKIDNFLDVEVDYVVRPDPVSSTATATLTVTMHNSAPTSGLPPYVVGNAFGLPLGTNRTWPWIFTQLPVVSATLDGEPAEGATAFEQGYRVWSYHLDIAPGATRTIELELAGPLYFADVYPLAFRTPAAVLSESTEPGDDGRGQDPEPSDGSLVWGGDVGGTRTRRTRRGHPRHA